MRISNRNKKNYSTFSFYRISTTLFPFTIVFSYPTAQIHKLRLSFSLPQGRHNRIFNLAFLYIYIKCKMQAQYRIPAEDFSLYFFCLRFGASPFNFTVSLSYISCGKTLHKRQISSSSSPNRHTVHVKTRTESEFLREAKIEQKHLLVLI